MKFSREEYELARKIVRPNGGRDPWPNDEIKLCRKMVNQHGLETMWFHQRKMFMMYANKPLGQGFSVFMEERLYSLAMMVWLYYDERKENNDGLQGQVREAGG